MQTIDPWIKNFRTSTKPTFLLFPFLIIVELFAYISNLYTHHSIPINFTSILTLVAMTLVIVVYLLMLSRLRVWKFHEQTRLRALSGDPTLLAPSQPADITPIAQPVKLPLVVEAHQKYLLVFIFLGFILGILIGISAIVFFTILFIANTPSEPPPPPDSHIPTIYITHTTLIIAGIVILVIILLAIVGMIIAYRHPIIHRIEATEQGITVLYQNKTRFLPWQSMRFFAVSPSTRASRLLYYELSSDTDYITWFTIQSPYSALSAYYQPIIPFDQYQHDTQTLLALIQLPSFNNFFPPKTNTPT
jgi:hypothetical protein